MASHELYDTDLRIVPWLLARPIRLTLKAEGAGGSFRSGAPHEVSAEPPADYLGKTAQFPSLRPSLYLSTASSRLPVDSSLFRTRPTSGIRSDSDLEAGPCLTSFSSADPAILLARGQRPLSRCPRGSGQNQQTNPRAYNEVPCPPTQATIGGCDPDKLQEWSGVQWKRFSTAVVGEVSRIRSIGVVPLSANESAGGDAVTADGAASTGDIEALPDGRSRERSIRVEDWTRLVADVRGRTFERQDPTL